MAGSVAPQMATTPRMAYTDIAGLGNLRSADPASVEKVAAQFESLFVGIWLQTMRDAGKVFGEGSYLSSDAVQMHQEMLDQQWSVHLAESGGIGLRDVIVAQISGTGPDVASGAGIDHGLPPRRQFAVAASAPSSPSLPSPEDGPAREHPDIRSVAPAVRGGGFKQAMFDNAQRFVDALRPVVEQVASASGIHPVAVLAQAALETGWGSKIIHDAEGTPSHNLFGIKAQGWSGPTAEVTTLEFEFGGFVRKAESFRAYEDIAESVRDYVAFLQGRERYAEALKVADQPERFADALQQAGYATDPGYAAKLKSLQQQIQQMLTKA